MRVMLLVQELTIGGLPNYVLDLARALSQAGDDVAVAHVNPQVPAHLDAGGVTLLCLDRAGGQAGLAKLNAWAPDVVHVHLCSDLALLRELLALGIPLVRSFHDYTSLCLRRGRRRFPGDRCQRALGPGCLAFGCGLGAPAPGSRIPSLQSIGGKLTERAAYQRFEYAVVGSRYMQSVLLLNGFRADQVRLIPYFSRFDAHAQGEPDEQGKLAGVPGLDRPLQFLFSGQAVAGKGLRVLVRALAHLKSSWRLTAIADGPELAAVKELAQRHQLADRIDFLGWLPQGQLAGHYRSADVLVVPSVWDDPGPLVGLEAMSMGTPVVGFPVGGIPDYVHEGKTGFLATEVSVASLADALARASARGAELRQLGLQARALVASVHGRDRHVGAVRSVYESMSIALAQQEAT